MKKESVYWNATKEENKLKDETEGNKLAEKLRKTKKENVHTTQDKTGKKK